MADVQKYSIKDPHARCIRRDRSGPAIVTSGMNRRIDIDINVYFQLNISTNFVKQKYTQGQKLTGQIFIYFRHFLTRIISIDVQFINRQQKKWRMVRLVELRIVQRYLRRWNADEIKNQQQSFTVVWRRRLLRIIYRYNIFQHAVLWYEHVRLYS